MAASECKICVYASGCTCVGTSEIGSAESPCEVGAGVCTDCEGPAYDGVETLVIHGGMGECPCTDPVCYVGCFAAAHG